MNILTRSAIFGHLLWCVCINICCASPFPDDGCTIERFDCTLKAYCTFYYNVRWDQVYNYNNGQCENLIHAYWRGNYGHFLPVNVVVEQANPEPLSYNADDVENYYGKRVPRTPNGLVQSFDISSNSYIHMPNIEGLINLKHLNVSNNLLTTVYLSNSQELYNLEEIDMSSNHIETVEVLETEFAYKGLKILNLSHNSITNLPESLFYNFQNLTYLDLSYNKMSYLNIYTFIGLKNILDLNLGYNLFKSLDSSLARLHTLENLDLNDNYLTELTYADLSSLTQLKKIDFSNNKIYSVESTLFNNMTNLTVINLSNNHLQLLEKDMFSNINLEYIDLSFNEIKKLPNRMFKDKNINYFSVTGNNIQGTLTKGTFEGLRLINDLDMSYQSITSIEDYAFFGIENVSELLLNNNKITNLSDKSFRLLSKLVRLELSHNNISNITLDFQDFLSLEHLSLAYNELTFIKKSNFLILNKLESLDLSNNKIKTIEKYSFQYQEYLGNLLINKNQLQGTLDQDTFNGLQTLPVLDLSYTTLSIVSNASFAEMTHLHMVNISHGILQDLCYNAFLNTGQIDTLDLSYNQLTNFNLNTTNLVNLKMLNLQHNLIKTLSDNFDFKHLQYLDMSYNDIHFIPDKALRNQSNLEYLNLSHNLNLIIDIDIIISAINLKSLHLFSIKSNNFTFPRNEYVISELDFSNSSVQNISALNLSEMKHLSNLILKHNQISKLLVGSFTNMSSLYRLDLSYNKLTFLQPGVFKDCEYLQILNMSHNLLVDINYGAFRGLKSSLHLLDISYNLLQNLKDEQFYEITSLTDLIVDNNKISDVTIEDFLSSNLNRISISGNSIPCQSLIRLKKQHDQLNITAITLQENSDHNYYGVTCIGDKDKENEIEYNKTETVTSSVHRPVQDVKILLDIRNTLSSLQNNSVHSGELSNQQTRELNDLIIILRNFQNSTVSSMNSEALKTNLLLERILKVLVAKNSLAAPVASYQPLNNDTTNDLPYLKKLKDLENSFIIEKERIVADIDNRLLELDKRIDNKRLDVVKEKNDIRSPTFTEVCVAIILLVLFCFVIFFIYKYKLSNIGNISLSTRRITDDIENSNL